MQRLEQSWALRATILGVVAVAVAIPLMPASARLAVAHWLGYLAPAFVIGAAVGWLTYSKKVWLITTGVLVALSVSLAVLGAYA